MSTYRLTADKSVSLPSSIRRKTVSTTTRRGVSLPTLRHHRRRPWVLISVIVVIVWAAGGDLAAIAAAVTAIVGLAQAYTVSRPATTAVGGRLSA
jgi:hypothetical protein